MSTLRAMPSGAMSLTMRVAAEVRAELARRQITQQQLAAAVGLSQASVSERLRGKTPFTTEDLEKVADALGIHPAVLLGGNAPLPQGPVTNRSSEESDTRRYVPVTNLRVLSSSRGEPGVMRTTRTVAA